MPQSRHAIAQIGVSRQSRLNGAVRLFVLVDKSDEQSVVALLLMLQPETTSLLAR